MANTGALGLWSIAEADPDFLAVVDPEHDQLTFGELAALANRISRGLRAAGLGRGDQVTTLLPNCFEQLAVCLAAYQSGLYVTTINWHFVGAEIGYIVNDAETRAFIVSERFGAEATKALAGCVTPEANRFCVGGPLEGFRPFDELVAGQSGARPEPEHLSTGSFMFYTSGTTGRPKGVRRALDPRTPDEAASTAGQLLMLFGNKPHDGNVQITQAPLYHTAVNSWTTMSLHMGHTVVLMDRWTAEGALERIERYRVTHSHMVPTMFNRLLQLPEEVRSGYDVSSLRAMVHAAAPCPVETKRRMIDWWGDTVWEYYAATEGGGTVVSAADWLQKPGTVGRAWPGCEVTVVDVEGNNLPPGESGTVYMKMPGSVFEYKDDEAKTAASRLRGLVTSTGGCDRSAMMAGCPSQHPIRWRFTVWHSASAQRNACASMRWRGRASASMRWPGAWAGTARRSIASSSAAAGAAAMTPRPRRRLRVCGLAGPRRPSWRAIPCWPRLSAGCSPTGCRRTRSQRSCAQRATASVRRRSTPPAMTTAAPGACPRAPGGCCRGAAGSAGPGAATRESPARWAISRRSRSARPASRTAASPATGRAI